MSPFVRRQVGALALMIATALTAPTARAVQCSATTTSVDFGAYDVFSAANDTSTGSVAILCQRQASDPASVGVAYVVTASTGSSSSYATRTLRSGANALNYNVYSNSNFTTVWGSGSSSTGVLSGSFTLTVANPNRNRTHTVFGRIPALQDAAVGVYGDNLLVTVNW